MPTLSEFAQHLSAELHGDPYCVITGIAPLDSATQGQISFLATPKYRSLLATTQASALILSPEDASSYSGNRLVMANPHLGYAKLVTLLMPKPVIKPGVHPSVIIGEHCSIASTASIAPGCVIGDNVSIGEHTIIGAGCILGDGSTVGDHCLLHARVTFYAHVSVGHRVILHSGVVLGSDGFGFANDQGSWYKIPQVGSVRIGNDVEIGANTTIDRGALKDTVIEEGVKLDNLIQIAHNVHIGAHTIIASGTGIAGSTEIGKYCMLGGNVGISDHLKIADGVILTASAEVGASITDRGIYSSGIPAQPNLQWRKNVIRFSQLDELARRVKKLEKEVKD